MVKILALCHGNKMPIENSKCLTSLINLKFIDKNKSYKPDIIQDLKKPFKSKIKYTTVCCDSDVFYNEKLKIIENQTFNNIKFALVKNGIS